MSASNSKKNIVDANTGFVSKFKSDFVILDRLGDGGFGVVFEVESKIDGKKYAIKRIDLTKHSSNLMEREIKIKDCDHINIVKFFEHWTEEPPPNWQENEDKIWMEHLNCLPIVLPLNPHNQQMGESAIHSQQSCMIPIAKPSKYLYIRMELCKKDNLADWLFKSNTAKRKREYLTILKQIVGALKYIYERDMIHRDLKPENILFGLDGQIKMSDFGTVVVHKSGNDVIQYHKNKIIRGESIEHTVGIGTKWYKAPEMDGQNYNSKVDIFSLGVILYEMISPFRTPSERHAAIEHLRDNPFPTDFNADFGKEFELMKRMLLTNPKKRPTIYQIEQHLSSWGKECSEVVPYNIFGYYKNPSKEER